MTPIRPNAIPLPAAVLALSVAVCLGAAGPVEASTFRGAMSGQAEQRQTFEHLLEAIQLAAKKLTDQLDSQTALHDRQGTAAFATPATKATASASEQTPAVRFLREALLNLPPPSC